MSKIIICALSFNNNQEFIIGNLLNEYNFECYMDIKDSFIKFELSSYDSNLINKAFNSIITQNLLPGCLIRKE